MSDLKVTLVRSRIGIKPKQRGTLRALGLRRIGSTNTLPDRPEVRGMIARVPHLVQVERVGSAPEDSGREDRVGSAPEDSSRRPQSAGSGREDEVQ